MRKRRDTSQTCREDVVTANDNGKLLRQDGFEKDFVSDEKLEIHKMLDSFHLLYDLPC
ncbi:hypothetical protein STEG23_023919, partial [Scotinomys teguina]